MNFRRGPSHQTSRTPAFKPLTSHSRPGSTPRSRRLWPPGFPRSRTTIVSSRIGHRDRARGAALVGSSGDPEISCSSPASSAVAGRVPTPGTAAAGRWSVSTRTRPTMRPRAVIRRMKRCPEPRAVPATCGAGTARLLSGAGREAVGGPTGRSRGVAPPVGFHDEPRARYHSSRVVNRFEARATSTSRRGGRV